jgi:hypothetical protein
VVTLPRLSAVKIRDDIRAPIVVLAALALSTGLAVAMAVAIAAVGDDDGPDRVVGGLTRTPDQTEEPTLEPTMSAASISPEPSASPEPTASWVPTEEPTAEPSPTAVPTAAGDNGVALALWSDVRGSWHDGGLTAATSNYAVDDTAPFMLTWAAVPGEAYTVEIAYDCAAIDSLTGIDTANPEPLLEGPGRTRPDGAVPLPGTSGLLLLYGGIFQTLPSSSPDDCDGERTVVATVTASGDTLTLIGAAHLAAADELTIEATVDGIGSAEASIE